MYCILMPEDRPDPRMLAERILRSMGGTSRLVGFHYALYMIDKIVTGERSIQLITKILYPETAKHFGVRPHAVERAIRTLIDICWRYGDRRVLGRLAGYELKNRPSNAEFLDMISAYIKTTS